MHFARLFELLLNLIDNYKNKIIYKKKNINNFIFVTKNNK
jgi:hypothetical protein